MHTDDIFYSRHHGQEMLAADRDAIATDIHWRIEDKRVYLNKDGKDVTLASLKLSAQQELNLLARIIAFYRDHYSDLDENFQGTALSQIEVEGKEALLINSNAKTFDNFSRSCAEGRSMRDGRILSRGQGFMLKQVLLMGADASEETTRVPSFNRAAACGHCRDEMQPFSDAHTRFISVPEMSYLEMVQRQLSIRLLDDQKILPESIAPNEFEAISVPLMALSPARRVSLPRLEEGSWVDRIKAGEAFMNADTMLTLQLAINTPMLGSMIDALAHPENYTLENVNKTLVNTLKTYYKHHHGNVDHIRAVLIRTEDGKCYVSASAVADHLPSKPPAAVSAAMQAFNDAHIKEVFVMDFDPKQTKQLEETHEDQPLTIKGFEGGELDRIRKNTSNGDKVTDPKRVDILGKPIYGRARLHVLPLNDGALTKEQLCEGINSLRVEDAEPLGFRYPKGSHFECSVP